MSPDDLPRLGVISNTSQDVLGRFAEWLSVKDRRVLCVGYAEHELERLVEPYRPAEIVCLTNWADHRDAQIARHRVVIGDLCGRTKLQDASFDAVLLFSVLEHLHDVDAALVELQRLLTPRGHVALLFGPAWSCAYGHHLYADPDDPNLNFVRWTLPAHMHLLCERDEIRAWYRRQGYADAVVESVLHWFYETPIINRLFYEDHVAALGRHFQIVASEIMYNDLPRAHLAALRARYPGYTDFSSYGGKFLLRAAG